MIADWCLHLHIRDPTSPEHDETTVAIFRPEEELRSQQFYAGQAVLFRNLKVSPSSVIPP